MPHKNEQMVIYTGYSSNVCQGRREKQGSCQSGYVLEMESIIGAAARVGKAYKKNLIIVFYTWGIQKTF